MRTKNNLKNVGIFCLLVGPILALSIFSYTKSYGTLTNIATLRRETVSSVASMLVKERLDRAVDIATSFATRVQFRKLIEEGKWDEAKAIIQEVPSSFSYVDAIFIADPSGVVRVITTTDQGAVGKDFSYRDWYKGLIREHKPYVSEAYKRASEPRYNIIAAAVPINNTEGKFIGVLALQIKLDTILSWTKDLNTDKGFVYITDQRGKVVAHPLFDLQAEELIDFSSVPVVKKALDGQHGVEIVYNPVEKVTRLSAYRSVPEYGWMVAFTEPVDSAFSERSRELKNRLIVHGAVTIMSVFFAIWFVRSRQKLSEARSKDEAILDNVNEGIIFVDTNMRIKVFNKAAETILGIGLSQSDPEAWGKEYGIYKPDEKTLFTLDEYPLTRALKGEIVTNLVQFVKNNKRKTGIYMNASGIPLRDSSGVITGAIGVIRDITKERQIDTAKTEFVSLASHQLRTPLSSVNWYTEMLLAGDAGKINDEQKKYLDEIYSGNQRMVALVNALLNVSRLELGTFVVEPEEMDVVETAHSVINELKPQIITRKLEVKETHKDIPKIIADPKLIRIVLQNLLSNAVKYTPEKGTITIDIKSVKKGDPVDQHKADLDGIAITVSDSGYGIPEGDKDKMFSKLFRAENVREMDTEGTGLGLYIVKSIVEHSEGKIWFESELNKGTTFYVLLPLEGMKKKEGTSKIE